MGSLQSDSPPFAPRSPAMRLLFVLLMSATISVALGGSLVRREAEPSPEADPHRRHGHHRHHSSSYYRPSYSSGYNNGYYNYNNRPNTPIRDLLPLKAAALA